MISYSHSSYQLYKSVDSSIIPTTQYIIDSISITPSLPEGLSLNTTTGSITGTPLAVSPSTEYTITASNSAHNTTTTIQIEITTLYCPADGEWTETEVVETSILSCPSIVYDGQKTRLFCYIYGSASWEEPSI